jgi:hypothetical protein
MRKFTAAVSAFALVASMTSAPAFAAVPVQAGTQSEIDSQCELDLPLDTNNITYTTEALITGESSGAPVEVAGSREEVPDSRTPSGTITGATGVDASESTQLVRHGKSPNIFATDVRAASVTYSNSEYDFTADYETTTTFSYVCQVTQHARTGSYVHNGTPGVNDCDAKTASTTNTNWGDDWGNCLWIEGQSVDSAASQFNTNHTIDQVDTEFDVPGHETSGGPYTFFESDALFDAVVCISPGSKGGTWRAQNNYGGLGGACSTATFNATAPGTAIPSASLPAV